MFGRFFHNLFTGTDNHSFDLGRTAWALTVLMGIIYQGIALAVKNQPFSVTDFGVGMGAILAAGGVGVAAKDLANPANRNAKVTVHSDQTNVDAGPGGNVNVAGPAE